MANTFSNFFDTCITDSLDDGSDQRVLVFDKSGASLLMSLTPLPGSFFERQLNATSIAEIEVAADDPDCCSQISDLFISQKIVWLRDDKTVWTGYITGLSWSINSVRIQAADVTHWWSVRRIPTYRAIGKDSSVILADIHRLAMIEDPIDSIRIFSKLSGLPSEIDVRFEENKMAIEIIEGLAEHSIDFTALGDIILCGGPDFLPELPFSLTDDDWQNPPTIEARGPYSGFATRIVGRNSAGDTIVKTADSKLIDIYGLVERVIDFGYLTSWKELDRAVTSNLALFSSPYYLNFNENNSALKTGAALPIMGMVPGVQIAVTSTSMCKQFRQRMRILSMRNDANGQVSITLEPVGATKGIF